MRSVTLNGGAAGFCSSLGAGVRLGAATGSSKSCDTRVRQTGVRRRVRVQGVAAPPPPTPQPEPRIPGKALPRTDSLPPAVNVVPISGHEEFLAAMAASQETLVVVKFYAGWCRACKAVGLKVQKIAADYPSCLFYEVCYEDNTDLCRNLGIKRLPTIQFYKGNAGKLEDFQVGPSRVHMVRQKLDTYVKSTCELEDKNSAFFKL